MPQKKHSPKAAFSTDVCIYTFFLCSDLIRIQSYDCKSFPIECSATFLSLKLTSALQNIHLFIQSSCRSTKSIISSFSGSSLPLNEVQPSSLIFKAPNISHNSFSHRLLLFIPPSDNCHSLHSSSFTLSKTFLK